MHCRPECPENAPPSKFPGKFCKTKGITTKLNPGTVQNIHELAKNIMPIWIDGVLVRGNKTFSGNRSFFCSWTLSHVRPTGFRFGGSCQEEVTGNLWRTPFFEADINPSTCASNLRYLYHPDPRIGLELGLQIVPWSTTSSLASIAYLGNSNTATLSLHDVRKESGRAVFSNMYNFRPHWSVGGEVLMEWMYGFRQFQGALAVRYRLPRLAVAATVSRNALDVTLWQKVTDNLQLGSSLVLNRAKQRGLAAFFYQWETSDVVIRGMMDSSCSVGFTYTKVIPGLSTAFGLSLLYCFPTSKLSCGFKLDADSNLA